MTLVAIRFHFDFIVANMLIHIVAIGLFFLLQLARGTSCNLVFLLELNPHIHTIVPKYT
jgi:hypothetical protein